jgi:hypothetical protein
MGRSCVSSEPLGCKQNLGLSQPRCGTAPGRGEIGPGKQGDIVEPPRLKAAAWQESGDSRRSMRREGMPGSGVAA